MYKASNIENFVFIQENILPLVGASRDTLHQLSSQLNIYSVHLARMRECMDGDIFSEIERSVIRTVTQLRRLERRGTGQNRAAATVTRPRTPGPRTHNTGAVAILTI